MKVTLENVHMMQNRKVENPKGDFRVVKFAELNSSGDGSNEMVFSADINTPGLATVPILDRIKKITLDVETYIRGYDTKMKIVSVSPNGQG